MGEALAKSVHGPLDVACVDCHTDPAAAEMPHPEKLAPPTCNKCHEDAVAGYDKSVHAESRRKTPAHQAAACWDCHGKHDMLSTQDPHSPVSHFNLTATCARCHGNPEVIARAKIKAGNVPALFRDSIHGRALEKSGLVVAPNCASCHGNHDIRRAEDKDSRVNRAHVPETCGACHQGIKADYAGSVHAAALARGNPRAAECATCHSAHQAQAVNNAWRLSMVSTCGGCHRESLRTYRDSFHGKATRLGFERAATCAACHEAHAVLPKNNPQSSVAPGNRAHTCRRCHANASASLAQYDPHADASNQSKNAALYYTNWGMRFLLLGVFGFFGLHTLFWMGRELRGRRKHPSGGPLA
jgi:predicted CXXCH cytochrome family protein